MAKHALCSASSAHRWIECPPSARLCAQYPDERSEYAQQGTDAHALCQYYVEKALDMKPVDPTSTLEFFDEEMKDCAEQYCNFVLETLSKAKESCSDPVILIEQKLDFSSYVEEGFGTGDCVIVADETIYITDYKHGLGVMVSAEMNPQMLCYALGALELFDDIYDINNVSLTVFQPRRENISTFNISKEDLLKWADEVLRPKAALAYAGEGDFKAGEHCQFCKAKATCRKRAEYNLELAKYDFAMPDTLNELEIAYILTRTDALTAWASDVKEYALQQALSGTTYEGFKVVEGKSNRKYTNESDVAAAVVAAGYDPYEKKIKGITAMTSELGKKKFEEILGKHVYKPQGKPVLVPTSDKRPVMNTAQNDFND